MSAFFSAYWAEIVLSLVTAGALAFCKYLHKQLKNYKSLLEEKDHDELNEAIDQKLQPIVDDIEELRVYLRQTRETEQAHVNLIISSYRFRLIQLCKIYIKQGFITSDQYDQLIEFYKVYEGFGGNGQAKEYYLKAIGLPMKNLE